MKINSLQAKTQVTDAKEPAQNCLVLPESAEEQPTKENNPPLQTTPKAVPTPTADNPTPPTTTAQTPPQ